ncbi:MAG: DUF5011 domain-containing protein [Bacteroidetes bacterium]|nr:DUF5011 domain-containing protein [Bacteroidota bacterium]
MKKQLFRVSIGLFTLGTIFLTGCSKDEDTTAPSITLSGSQSITASLPATAGGNGSFVEPGFSATDDEDGTITSSVTVSGTVDLNRKGTYTLTYTVADKAGNSTSVNRTVQVVNDAEVFGGAYNNSVDSSVVSPPAAFNATVTTSDTVNNLVKINNFGSFGLTVNVWATINGTTTGSSITVPTPQDIGTTAQVVTVFSSDCFVITGAAPTTFKVKYTWNDGANGDTSWSFYIR